MNAAGWHWLCQCGVGLGLTALAEPVAPVPGMNWVLLAGGLFLVFTPFFGTQAVRLLRESWGGEIQKDPEGKYFEQGATQLAEELYAMFDDSIPQTQNAPVAINKTNPNAPANLTLNNPLGGNTFDVNGGNTTIGGNTDPTNNFPGDTITIGGITTGGVTVGGSVFNPNQGTFLIGGNRIVIDKNGINTYGPIFNNGPVTNNDDVTNNGTVTGGGGGGGATTSFLGKVISGTGNRYKVALYGNGSSQPSTATVTATVPQIDPNEQIPADTWIAAVHAFTSIGPDLNPVVTYEFQPPVYLYG